MYNRIFSSLTSSSFEDALFSRFGASRGGFDGLRTGIKEPRLVEFDFEYEADSTACDLV